MNKDDIRIIEERLGITLPTAYRQALLAGLSIAGNDPEPYFEQSAKELLITNLELRLVSRQDAFAGAPWPSRFVWIGTDGCGNLYCIDADDPTCSVRFFDHELNGFTNVADNLPDYFAYLSDLFAQVAAIRSQAPAAATTTTPTSHSPNVEVARTDNPRESVLDPISLAEWTAFVTSDPDLEMHGFRTLINPFTKEETRIESPGLAIMDDGGSMKQFHFGFGRVSVRRPGSAALEKLKQAARALNAKLIPGG